MVATPATGRYRVSKPLIGHHLSSVDLLDSPLVSLISSQVIYRWSTTNLLVVYYWSTINSLPSRKRQKRLL